MLQLSSVQSSRNLLQRLAHAVCILFGVSLLVIMTAVLGNALNDGLPGYGIALALVSALSVLVLHVLASSTTHPAMLHDISQTSHPDKLAA